MDVDEKQDSVDEDQQEKPPVECAVPNAVSKRGRPVVRRSYKESEGSEGDDPLLLGPDNTPPPKQEDNEDSEEEAARYALRARPKRSKNLAGFVETDDDEDDDDDAPGYNRRSKSRNGNKGKNARANGRTGRITRSSTARPQASTSRPSRKRVSARRTRISVDDEGYEDVPSSGSADADGSLDDAPRTSSDHELDGDADAEGEVDADAERDQDQDQENKGYALRKRNPGISYALVLPQDDLVAQPQKSRSTGSQPRRNGSGKGKVPGWSATGAELGRFLGVPQAGDDSVCVIYHGMRKRTNRCCVTRTLIFLRGHHGSNRSAREA